MFVHDIVETSKMSGEVVNARVNGTCIAQSDMDNGRFIVVNEGALTASYPADATVRVTLHASVDRMGDTLYGSTDFYVTNGSYVRNYEFAVGDEFATTAIDYSGDRKSYSAIVVGDTVLVHLGDGKATINAPATAIPATNAFVGIVIAKKTLGFDRNPAIVIKVVRC